MRVIILSGLPGSGKSTYAQTKHPNAMVFSADAYFMQNGEYQFDPSKLGEAHGACLRGFIRECQTNAHHESIGNTGLTIIVDNTNLSTEEVAPYYSVAKAYGAEVEIVTILCDPSKAQARNVHGVPEKAYAGMLARLKNRKFPPFWDVKHHYVEN